MIDGIKYGHCTNNLGLQKSATAYRSLRVIPGQDLSRVTGIVVHVIDIFRDLIKVI